MWMTFNSMLEVVYKSQESSLQTHIDVLSEWCNVNAMKPKPEKCKVMRFSFFL